MRSSRDIYQLLQEAFPTHAEAKRIADVCARIEGTTFVAAAGLSLAAALVSQPLVSAASFPAFAVGGTSVLGYLALRRGTRVGGSTLQLVTGIAQLRLLAGLGAIFVLGGAGGMFLPSSAGVIGSLIVAAAGLAFAVHRQHGAGLDVRKARRIQRPIAVTLLFAAALGLSGWAIPAAIAVLGAGVLLLAYFEPPGAIRGRGLTTHYMDLGEFPRR